MHAQGSEPVDRGRDLVLPGSCEVAGVLSLLVKGIEQIEPVAIEELLRQLQHFIKRALAIHETARGEMDDVEV